MRLNNPEKIRSLIFSRVFLDPKANCWEWNGCRNQLGYGQLRFEGVLWLLHRLTYTLFIGEIPKGLFVCHSCDNPSCCNPEHLWVGTHTHNMRDAALKGRIINRNTRKTHCVHGHKFTPENTHIRSCGERVCRQCCRDRRRKQREVKKA